MQIRINLNKNPFTVKILFNVDQLSNECRTTNGCCKMKYINLVVAKRHNCTHFIYICLYFSTNIGIEKYILVSIYNMYNYIR